MDERLLTANGRCKKKRKKKERKKDNSEVKREHRGLREAGEHLDWVSVILLF